MNRSGHVSQKRCCCAQIAIYTLRAPMTRHIAQMHIYSARLNGYINHTQAPIASLIKMCKKLNIHTTAWHGVTISQTRTFN